MIDFLKFVNQSDEDKYNMLLEGQAEIQQLKSTLDEIIEYIENHYEDRSFDEIHNEIIQIIYRRESV